MNMIVGLTGGIGTGKSTVSALFNKWGAFIIDADKISRDSLNVGSECYHQTIDTFGTSILNADGEVDRKALAKIVFSSDEELKKLNSIIHPYVRCTIHSHTISAIERDAPIIVWDVPLLLEGGYERDTDAVVVVTCPTELRLERLKIRNGMSPEECYARINAQMSDYERMQKADFVIENDGSLSELYDRARNVYDKLLSFKK